MRHICCGVRHHVIGCKRNTKNTTPNRIFRMRSAGRGTRTERLCLQPRRRPMLVVFSRPKGSGAMKCGRWSFAMVSLVFAVLLSSSIGTLNARDADLVSRTFAAAQTAKQKCTNACRARYRDCRRLNQLPSAECRGVYRDCTRYTCTGLGPG